MCMDSIFANIINVIFMVPFTNLRHGFFFPNSSSRSTLISMVIVLGGLQFFFFKIPLCSGNLHECIKMWQLLIVFFSNCGTFWPKNLKTPFVRFSPDFCFWSQQHENLPPKKTLVQGLFFQNS